MAAKAVAKGAARGQSAAPALESRTPRGFGRGTALLNEVAAAEASERDSLLNKAASCARGAREQDSIRAGNPPMAVSGNALSEPGDEGSLSQPLLGALKEGAGEAAGAAAAPSLPLRRSAAASAEPAAGSRAAAECPGTRGRGGWPAGEGEQAAAHGGQGTREVAEPGTREVAEPALFGADLFVRVRAPLRLHRPARAQVTHPPSAFTALHALGYYYVLIYYYY
ncbi:hypothetical protein T492DRAFT_59189 [Pavlovales sp. CCMP2436]|nr:hypothetical protein T492DRAFT_59189 [Pavlovales sp. CCMP2436]